MRLRDPGLLELRTDPLMDPLRQEPRFQAVMRELKFPDQAGTTRTINVQGFCAALSDLRFLASRTRRSGRRRAAAPSDQFG